MERTKRRTISVLLAGTLLAGVLAPAGAGAQVVEPTPAASATVAFESTPTPEPTALPTPEPTPVPTAIPTPAPACQEDWWDEEQRDGASMEEQLIEQWMYDGRGDGPRNVVKLLNRRSGQLRVRGNVQLNRIGSDTVDPFNYAIAYNACGEEASTFSVALQVNLYREEASEVAPENYGYAVNYGCHRCAAFAYAVQLAYPVADPREVPEPVWRLVRELDRELREIHTEQNWLTLAQAHARVKAVVDQFKAEIPAHFAEVEHQATPTV